MNVVDLSLSFNSLSLWDTITDYKCQGSTYKGPLVLDLKKPDNGSSPAASAYVQLSRARLLDQIHILRPFDEIELMTPLSDDLKAELEWEKSMYKNTKKKFPIFLTLSDGQKLRRMGCRELRHFSFFCFFY